MSHKKKGDGDTDSSFKLYPRFCGLNLKSCLDKTAYEGHTIYHDTPINPLFKHFGLVKL